MTNTDVRFEHLDVRIWTLLAIAVGIVIAAILIHVSVFAMYRSFLKHEPQNVADVESDLNSFPEPRLQVDPQTERRNDRQAKTNELNSYGWVDRPRGIVHMPIEKAMDLMLRERGPENK